MSTARVLVVDDEQPVLDIASSMLSREGYQVFSADSSRQALEIVKAESIDLVLSDLILPEVPGTELLRHAAQLRPGIAFLLMTGGVVDAAKVPAGISVIRKPLSAEVLISAVRATLKRSDQISSELTRSRQISAALRRESKLLRSESESARLHSKDIVQECLAARQHREQMDSYTGVLDGAIQPLVSAPRLTVREMQVLKLICEGRTGKQIAGDLGITFKTAVSHRQHIMEKLHIRNAVGLLRYAIRNKLIDP